MGKHYKNSGYFMAWYHALGDQEKKEFNRKRYERQRQRDELLGIKKIPKNQDYNMCSSLYKRAKDIPFCLVDDTTKPSKLLPWYLERKGKPCKYCGQESTSIDHIVPVSRGGKHCLTNLQVICFQCNRAKSNLSEEQFIAWINRLTTK